MDWHSTTRLTAIRTASGFVIIYCIRRISQLIVGEVSNVLWCHSVVYCSRQCQHDDWRVFHREECPNSRLNRIGTYTLSL
ncbi:hypothetical protein FA13DRAFT_756989 [Coprinellus micaceus]|uniref:MYND-type domain-containing protein n=1 Tax=Coprinellus micaceus TaxID=71717 RepID=A0A4Y7T5C2_COPMI|nr:hypothetical protein FA13DRAFT_756989 [Coprinellus micaceus]